MIDFGREVILRSGLLTRKGENPSIPSSQESAVWQRVKGIHKTENIRINLDLPGGEVACPRSRGRHRIHLRNAQGRPQALVITENESPILLNRPSKRISKLIHAEGPLFGGKEIPRL